jgi:amino acid transporter
MFLGWLNYRRVLATLNFNLVITAFAFIAIILLFLVTAPWLTDGYDGATSFNHHCQSRRLAKKTFSKQSRPRIRPAGPAFWNL